MRSTFLCTVLLLSSIRIWAQETVTLTPELLWKVGRVSLADATADGNYFIYTVGQPDVAANQVPTTTYLYDMKARKATALPAGADGARFSADGPSITYLLEGQLFSQLMDGRGQVQRSEQNTDGYLISPKGKYLLTHQEVMYNPPPNQTNTDLSKTTGKVYDGLFYRHWKNYDAGKRNNYFLANRDEATGKYGTAINIVNGPHHAPTKPFGDISEAVFSTDERFVVYTCRKEANGTAEARSTNTDIYLYDITSKQTLNVTEGLPGYDKEPAFSPDGNYLLWTSMATPQFEADRPRLLLLDTKTNVRRDMTQNWTYEVNQPQWSKDSKTIYFLSSQDFTYHIYAMDVRSGRIRQITQGQHDYDAFVVTDRGIIATRHDMTHPNEVYQVDITTGRATQITDVNASTWTPIKKATVQRETVKTTDGLDMNVWMVLPPDFDPTKKYPTLLYCQGGPQSPASQFFSYRWNVQLMASQGYVVVVPCRRGMPGSGEAWNKAISGDWGGQAMQDLLSASDAAAKKPYVDANKMGAVGASFGGYSVYWLAGNHNKRFKTFISHCGLFNLESFYGTTEEMFFAEYDLGKPYWETPQNETWLKDSPHKYVQNWDTPILVIHNELDYRVPFGEGMQAYQAAQLKGLKSKFLMFPDEGHHVTKPQNSMLWQRTFFGWLDETLKNPKP
jgi:dipeptidyl aminopeptidase/acylaminoacyl peptidase